MANLYFCQPHSRSQGILRAVLSSEEYKHLTSSGSEIFIGEQFPQISGNPEDTDDFAILKIHADEADPLWRPGFYRFASSLAELDDALHKLGK